MSEELGVPVIFSNIPGASSQIATEAFLQREADGYTIFGSNLATVSTMYALQKEELGFEWDEKISWLGTTVVDSGVLIVAKDSPIQTIEDLMEEAKKRPVSIGVAQWRMTDTLAVLQLIEQTGEQNFHIVPFGEFRR